MKRKKLFLTAIKDNTVDFLISKAPTLGMAFLGAGGMTYLAKLSEPLNVYGPIVWGSIGLVCFLLICLSLAFVGLYLEKRSIANFTTKIVENASTNPLSPQHQNRKINLIDFFHPFYKPAEHVRFEKCDIMGPANLHSEGGRFNNCAFHDCEIIIVREDRPIRGVVPLREPLFIDCHLYRVSFLMPINQYRTLPQQMRENVIVISDGRIGDV